MDVGRPATHAVTLEAFGVPLEVDLAGEGDPARLAEVLPPGWRPADVELDHGRFKVVSGNDRLYITLDGTMLADAADMGLAYGVLDAQIRAYVALHAPDHIFVHAGVVALEGRALVLPGSSFAGKTTLVAALVKAGATYYSDEFAVLDANGHVHSYPKPLSMRPGPDRAPEDRSVESLGGRAGSEVIEVGLIALTEYREDATWNPRRCTPGEGALALMSHTIPARTRPDQTLQAVRAAAQHAVVLRGDRGDAEQAAEALLAERASGKPPSSGV